MRNSFRGEVRKLFPRCGAEKTCLGFWVGDTRGMKGGGKLQPGDIVLYRGRQYYLKWIGETKWGHKAKLQYLDFSKEFWVDSYLVVPFVNALKDDEL